MKHTVREVTLDNGAKGLVVHVPGVDVARMHVEFRAGFDLGDWQKYELPHVMEHMMFTNKTYPKPRQFSRAVERNGAYHNAVTTGSSLIYQYECAEFEAERIAELIGIQMTEPTFPAAELKNEIGNVVEELNDDLSSQGASSWSNLGAAISGEPGLKKRIEQLESITNEDLKSWYSKTHLSGNMRFVIAGDTDFDNKILKHLNVGLPGGGRMEVPRIENQSLDKPLAESRDVPQIYYSCASWLDKVVSYRQLVGARIISNVLSEGFSSTLLGEARERGLVYVLGMGVMDSYHDTNWRFGGTVSPEHAEEFFSLAAEEIQKARKGQITKKQFETTKKLLRGERALGYQKVSNLVGYYMHYIKYDKHEDFDELYRLLDEIQLEEAVVSFNELFKQKTKGLSLVGNVDEKSAQKYQDILAPIWS